MGLNDIQPKHVREALKLCRELGELEFLRRYAFQPARRFLLVHQGRYYQSKAIVGAAHEFATGHALTHKQFSGGKKHAVRLLEGMGFVVVEKPLDDWKLWPRLDVDVTTLAGQFPGWRRWNARHEFPEVEWPGVYVIGVFSDVPPKRVFPLPESVVYVGQTTRTLRERLAQFAESAGNGKAGHSGGLTFHKTGEDLGAAWLSVLPVRLTPGEQSGAITVLEGLLLWAYARRWGRPPSCNSK